MTKHCARVVPWLSVLILVLSLLNSAGSIPVAGIPMQVIRTYDSRDKREGDCGVGWTLDIKNIRLQKNRNLGLNWEQAGTSSGLGNYNLTSRKPRTVTITFPDGKTQKFRARSNPESQIFQPTTGPPNGVKTNLCTGQERLFSRRRTRAQC